MRSLLKAFSISILLSLSASCSSQPDYKKSIFRVENISSRGWGTAFAVEYDGKKYLATNEHVCELGKKEGKMYVASRGNSRIEVDILGISKDHDLCLLEAFPEAEPVRLHDSKPNLKDNEKLYTAGFPAVPFMYETEGVFAGVKEISMGFRWPKEECEVKRGKFIESPFGSGCVVKREFLITHIISDGGCSGSPIFNSRGEVVGIISIGMGRIGFIGAVPLKYLKDLLKEVSYKDEGAR